MSNTKTTTLSLCYLLACDKNRFGFTLVHIINFFHQFQERQQVCRWTVNGPIPEVEHSDYVWCDVLQ